MMEGCLLSLDIAAVPHRDNERPGHLPPGITLAKGSKASQPFRAHRGYGHDGPAVAEHN